MKFSESAREMEELTDTMIISLMEEMKALALSNKEVDNKPSSDATREPSALDEMKNVLTLYEGIIEQLWKIAENIAKTSTVEEQHAGTVFMGSSGDGTYVPELSSEFDTYVMEEDSQYELQEDLEAMDTAYAEKNPEDRSHMLKVCCLIAASWFECYSSGFPETLSDQLHRASSLRDWGKLARGQSERRKRREGKRRSLCCRRFLSPSLTFSSLPCAPANIIEFNHDFYFHNYK